MEVISESRGDVQLLSLMGSLDVHSAPKLMETIDELLENGNTRMVIDMTDVDFISSYGLGTLATSLKNIKEKGGALKLCGLKPEVKAPFEVTGLLPKFSIFENEDDAVGSFTK